MLNFHVIIHHKVAAIHIKADRPFTGHIHALLPNKSISWSLELRAHDTRIRYLSVYEYTGALAVLLNYHMENQWHTAEITTYVPDTSLQSYLYEIQQRLPRHLSPCSYSILDLQRLSPIPLTRAGIYLVSHSPLILTTIADNQLVQWTQSAPLQIPSVTKPSLWVSLGYAINHARDLILLDYDILEIRPTLGKINRLCHELGIDVKIPYNNEFSETLDKLAVILGEGHDLKLF